MLKVKVVHGFVRALCNATGGPGRQVRPRSGGLDRGLEAEVSLPESPRSRSIALEAVEWTSIQTRSSIPGRA